MRPDLAREVVSSLGAPVELLPVLPELLAGLPSRSGSATEAVEALRGADLGPGAHMLDLGCGTGALAVACAHELRFEVVGVDAVEPFLEEARQRARDAGVGPLCAFQALDVRRAFEGGPDFDLVTWLGVGRGVGPLPELVERLRGRVRPGGYILIEDAFLLDAHQSVPGYEGHAGLERTRAELTCCGDRIVAEHVHGAAVTADRERLLLDKIRQNARAITERSQVWRDAIQRFLDAQLDATRILETKVKGALWLIRRESD